MEPNGMHSSQVMMKPHHSPEGLIPEKEGERHKESQQQNSGFDQEGPTPEKGNFPSLKKPSTPDSPDTTESEKEESRYIMMVIPSAVRWQVGKKPKPSH